MVSLQVADRAGARDVAGQESAINSPGQAINQANTTIYSGKQQDTSLDNPNYINWLSCYLPQFYAKFSLR